MNKRIQSVWRGPGAAFPRALFLGGADGFFFDFSTPATLFQDAAGAMPLTAAAQTIGLVCDKSRPRSPVTAYAGMQASAGLRPAWGNTPKSGGQPPFGYAALDLVDDALAVTLPAIITGDLMIFGRAGSWIEAGVTIPAGAWSLGPTGTVLTPGILRALGQIVGVVLIARTTTADERAKCLRYFTALGAANWLIAGAEGVVNGTFTTNTAGWISTNATLAMVGGELEFTATVAGAHNVQRGVAVTPGTPYLLSFDARFGTMTVLRYSVYNATGAANIVAPTTYAASGVTKRFQFVFIPPAGCVTANVYMARDSGSAGTAYFDNVSCKPLTPGA